MPNFNKVIVAGNLTRDPEMRYTPKGMAIAKLSLAINRQWRDEAGQTKEEVTFVEIDAFGKQAETIAQYVKKGQPLLVEGRLRQDTWDDKTTGAKRSKLGVVLEGFQFLSSGNREGGGGFSGAGEGGGSAPRPQQARPAARPQQPVPPPNDPDVLPPEEDDVPF